MLDVPFAPLVPFVVAAVLVFCLEAAAEPVLLVGRSGFNDAVDCAPWAVEGVSAPFVEGPAEDKEGLF